MIVRKMANAGELLWDSLDHRERVLVAYAAAWVLLLAVFAVQRRSRERFRRELLAELTTG